MKKKFVLIVLLICNLLIGYSQNFDSITDSRDGQKYKIVQIGDQWWMAQNLNFYTSNGSSYYKNDSVQFAGKYGRLYNWATANSVCPDGWHLSTHNDWKKLENFLGIPSDVYHAIEQPHTEHPYIGTNQGGFLKDTILWGTPNTGATNSTGFSAIPAGLRHADNAPDPWKNNFYDLGIVAHFWASEYSLDNAYVRILSNDKSAIHIIDSNKSAYRSVRCVKDN